MAFREGSEEACVSATSVAKRDVMVTCGCNVGNRV